MWPCVLRLQRRICPTLLLLVSRTPILISKEKMNYWMLAVVAWHLYLLTALFLIELIRVLIILRSSYLLLYKRWSEVIWLLPVLCFLLIPNLVLERKF